MIKITENCNIDFDKLNNTQFSLLLQFKMEVCIFFATLVIEQSRQVFYSKVSDQSSSFN
jgi:hypothetical protein